MNADYAGTAQVVQRRDYNRTVAGSWDAMETLYKFVNGKRALHCIPEVGEGTLRATQPAALNDPFECAVRTLYNPNESRGAGELANVLTKINERNPITADDVRRARLKYGSLLTRTLFAEQVSTRFGIVSFTTNPYHPLMWSHYTTDGSGFVIGYDSEELNKLVGTGGCLREVAYGEEPPPIIDPIVLGSPGSNLPKLLSVKSSYWRYEDEWRMIVELNRTLGTGETDQYGQPINLVQIPNEAVVSVHYTERTCGDAVELIQKRLADKNNRYQAQHPHKLILSSTSYSYEEAQCDCQC